jgi:peptide/nickel transport system substrate-binding protein
MGCVQEPLPPGDSSNRIIVLLDSATRALDPRFTIDSTSTRVSRLIFSSLTSVDNEALEPRKSLAESIEEDPENPKIWHVQVRKGVVFHDGTPLRGKDIAYTYNSILDPALGSPYRGDFQSKFVGVSVDPNDPYHVLFQLKRRYATFRTDLVLGVVPESLKRAPNQKFPEGSYVGTGPFRFHSKSADRMVSLRRFDDWYGSPPAFEWLVFKIIRDENTRILSLLGGSSDISINGISPILLDVLEEREDIVVKTRPGIGFTYLGLNLRNPRLATPDVRRALSLALNREGIIQERFLGGAKPATSMLPTFHWGYRKTTGSARYAPAEAEELLEQAGFPRDPVTGIRFSIELKLSSNRFRMSIARMMVRDWRAIGVEVSTRAFEFSTFFSDVRKGRFDIFLLQLPEPIEPDMYRWMLYSLSTPEKRPETTSSPYAAYDRSAFVPKADTLLEDPVCAAWAAKATGEGWIRWAKVRAGFHPSTGNGNRTYYANPRFDCLVEMGQAEPDFEKRKELYGEIQEILDREVPVIPLWHENQVAFIRKEVRGFSLLPTSQFTPILRAKVAR